VTIILITAGGLLIVFFIVVMFLKVKNNLSWASAFREAFEYLWSIF
jgi:hypothetical protein